MKAPASPRSGRLLGIALRIGATISFGIMAAIIKLGHEAGIALVELAFYRFVFGLPPLLVWIAVTRNFGAWRTDRPGAHVARGMLGFVAMTLAFGALAYLPLAESSTIGFAAPLFSVILSALILGETVGRYRWTAVALGFAGVVIVMQPSGADLPLPGVAMALLSTLGVAGVTIAIRQMSSTESTPTIVLWFTGFSIVASGLLMPFFATGHPTAEWLLLIGLGVAGGIGQLFLTSSLRFAPVSVVVPFDYAQLFWAVLLGWLIWDTRPPGTTWLGAAIIIGSGLFTVYREHRLGRDRPHRPPLSP